MVEPIPAERIARLFGVPMYVLFGSPASIARRRARLARMHRAYRRRRA